MIAGPASQFGLAYLIPAFRAEGLSLPEASLLVTTPSLGLLVSLIAWGALADRVGERLVMAVGMTGAGVALLIAAGVSDPLLRWLALFASGLFGASIHAATGRLILGWFEARERGLAMGVRQTGHPIGLALAAVVLPGLAISAGIGGALTFLAVLSFVAAGLVALVVRDPLRGAAAGPAGPAGRNDVSAPSPAASPATSPYRGPYLWRIHAASALLVVPQFAVAVFAFDALVTGHGIAPAVAGTVLAVAQLGGAATRLGAGAWSDRALSRLRPMRTLALAGGIATALLAVATFADPMLALAAAALATALTVATNVLAFTAVAERAGRAWSGRALGIQNTFQNGVAAAVPPLLALIIGAVGAGVTGYAVAFSLAAIVPFGAALVIPVGDER